MTIGELKAMLSEIPDDWPVVKSIDDEGNGFSELYSVERYRWDASEGEIKLFEFTDESIREGYTEDDFDPTLPPAIVLW